MRYAVFILSHERATDQITLYNLIESGYSKDWYILVDNLDKQLDEYKKKYGDHVYVFDKEEYAQKTDTLFNQKQLGSVVYARNAVYDVAEKLGYDYFGQFDDDCYMFRYRYEKNGKLVSARVKDITKYFDAVVNFMDEANLIAYGIPSAGALVGGLDTFNKEPKQNFCQSFFCSVKRRIQFSGAFANDLNGIVYASKTGYAMLEPLLLVKQSPDRSTNSGGLHDHYHTTNRYVWQFYPVIYSPSNVYVVYRKGDFHGLRLHGKMIPKILNERWRK